MSPIYWNNIREGQIGSTGGQQPRCGRLALLVGDEATISIPELFALNAKAIAGRQLGHASRKHGRGCSEGKKQCAHFSLLRLDYVVDGETKPAESM